MRWIHTLETPRTSPGWTRRYDNSGRGSHGPPDPTPDRRGALLRVEGSERRVDQLAGVGDDVVHRAVVPRQPE